MANQRISLRTTDLGARARLHGAKHAQYYSDIGISGSARTHLGDNIAENITINHIDELESPDEAQKRIRNALLLTRPGADRAALISQKGKRVPGTCEWIRDDRTYKSWLAGEMRLLWISGGPGKGKTIMSIFLTQEAEEAARSGCGGDAIYFFCTAGDTRRDTATAALRGLLYQLVVKHSAVATRIGDYFETAEEAQCTISSRETLWMLFEDAIAIEGLKITCIVDGLDECDEGSAYWLSAKFCELQQSMAAGHIPCDFKCMIVSRDLVRLQKCPRIRLDLDKEHHISTDVLTFVSARVQELSHLEDFDETFRARVEITLLARAEDTFLWIGFVMTELVRQRTCRRVLQTLDTLPEGLPAIYSRILLQLDPDQIEIAAKILMWVTLAARPLTLRELADAVDLPSSGLDSRTRDMRDQVISCGPILALHDVFHRWEDTKRGQTVTLVHQSVRDYLLRSTADQNHPLEHLRVKPGPAHVYMAGRCLEVWKLVVLQGWPIDGRRLQCDVEDQAGYFSDDEEHQQCLFGALASRRALGFRASGPRASGPRYCGRSRHTRPCLGREALLSYAVFHWPSHARFESPFATQLYDRHPDFFSQHVWLRSDWHDAYHASDRHHTHHRYLSQDVCPELVVAGADALEIACCEGILPWARHILTKTADLPTDQAFETGNDELRKTTFSRSLTLAIRSRHVSLVRLLCEHGALSPQNNGDKIEPLYEAIALYTHDEATTTANLDIIDILLTHGVAMEKHNRETSIPLMHAASLHKVAIMELLIEQGADVNAADPETGLDALEIVTRELGSGTQRSTLESLLAHGASYTRTLNDGSTLLHVAGTATAVEVLLENGASVYARSDDGSTPLIAAAEGGRVATVEALLEAGADSDAQDDRGNTAMHACSRLPRKSAAATNVTRLLIEHGADTSLRDRDSLTAHELAKRNGHYFEYEIRAVMGLALLEVEKELSSAAIVAMLLPPDEPRNGCRFDLLEWN